MSTLMEVTPFTTTDVSTAVAPVLENFTFANIAPMIAIALGGSVGLVLAWFGVKFIVTKVQKALKKGKA